MQSGKGESDVSRRNLIKSGGITLGTCLVPGMAGATSKDEETNSERADRIHNRARKIREKTGSQKKYKQFLSDNSDYIANKKSSFTPESMDEEGVSTQNWSEGAISTDLTLTYYYPRCASEPYAYIDYNVEVNSDYNDRGEGGPDQQSIGWANHHYRYIENSAYSDGGLDNLNLVRESLNGVDWEWEDGYSF